MNMIGRFFSLVHWAISRQNYGSLPYLRMIERQAISSKPVTSRLSVYNTLTPSNLAFQVFCLTHERVGGLRPGSQKAL